MTWSFTPWKIYFTNRQQIIYLYFSEKFFFKFFRTGKQFVKKITNTNNICVRT